MAIKSDENSQKNAPQPQPAESADAKQGLDEVGAIGTAQAAQTAPGEKAKPPDQQSKAIEAAAISGLYDEDESRKQKGSAEFGRRSPGPTLEQVYGLALANITPQDEQEL